MQTEPQTLPTKYRDSFTYRNQVSTSDDGTNWIPQSTADKTLCGGADILKELGQTFTYDGEKVTSEKDGKDDGHSEKIIQNALTGSGQYASWVFKLNYAGELSGTYRVLETIPDGMELAYIRIKWVGPDQKKQGFVESKKIADLDEGWKEKQTTAGTDDAVDGNKTTTYYVKGNQALIALGDFYPGKATDSYSVDVQVVCKVVDPKVLLGGEKKKFTNYVTLQTQDGQDIRSAFSSATIETKNLEKTVKNTEPNKDEKVHFTIKANELGQTLPTKDGTTLKLIDKLSSTLILDTSTIRVVNSKNTSENVTFTASLGADNTLEIQIPCDQPVTITYTATVNAPPGVRYIRLLNQKLKIKATLHTCVCLFKNLMKNGDYVQAGEILELMDQKWHHREEFWTLKIQYLAERKMASELQKCLRQMQEEHIYLSSKSKEALDFWLD